MSGNDERNSAAEHPSRDGGRRTGSGIASRFRSYLPVVVDMETSGFDAACHGILEVAAVIVGMDAQGRVFPAETHDFHVEPFSGCVLDPAALAFTGIDPHHPFRGAVTELHALQEIFRAVRRAVREAGCKRAILTGHNAAFDLAFLNAAVARTGIKRNPFHPFSTFDTVSLAGLAFGETVLARAAKVAGIVWDHESAHSAIYDAERTADLFCMIVNRWDSCCPVATASE